MPTKTLGASSLTLGAETRDWTRVVAPGTYVSEALAGISSPQSVQKGIKATKVARRGQLAKRVLTISEDRYALFVTHKKLSNGKKGVSFRVASTLKTPFKAIRGIFVQPAGITGGGESFVRYIDVADINGVQEGVIGTQKLELAQDKLDKKRDEIVTIIHHGNRTVDVALANPEKRTEFMRVVKEMIDVYQDTKSRVGNEELLLRYIWYDVDANRDGSIGLKEFSKILLRINLKKKNASKIFKKYCKEVGESSNVGISYHQLMCLIQRIKSGHYDDAKKDILSSNIIWDSVFGSEVTHVSSEDFLNHFLVATQHETNAKLTDVQFMFMEINDMEINRENEEIRQNHISRTRFEMFLHHESNDAYDPKKQEFDQATLNEPISKYWINSSHNTYLTGDQLRSASSVECYMNALRRGCKCLELDCWDGENKFNNVPVVFHGYTLTSKIAFEEIILAVKGYVKSNPDTYPIILSLENHCSHPYQSSMAKMLKDILGISLWCPDKAEIEHGNLPSPESLRGKVIVKGKRPPETKEEEEKELPTNDEPEEDDPYDETNSGRAAKAAGGKKPKIVKELADLTLFHGTKYTSFQTSIAEPPSHMHSICEPKIDKILSKDDGANAKLWRSYNANHMTRTYPSGVRINSSNYNPVLAWSTGSQLVALNFQTADTPLLLNDGLFKQNGNCGYVKKPDSVLGQSGMKSSTQLRIRILCGSCLPKPNGATEGEYIDPYVLVAVHDVKNENGKESYVTSKVLETKTEDDNGFCPMWNQTKFETATIHNPDVAMIEFSLQESDPLIDDNVANASIPFSCLRRGYRSIQLYDTHNTRSGPFGFATLVVEIDYDPS
mmetsp:Transcript_9705/g.14902  ORF Transcript_9705/g.14902 Transcript_9705/m.14902 type:complete len:839 (-) Transcript_9705:154-2670(-)|eukprot:CAMPEP_0195302908 /NCGR_PEP_ID=MMETSP0707-20130614/31909_1 /TAXON_ID=33640 /ORGANISM="Asterionellopsis glacialis, Strain CCMP134" /LENGTH=838 /DNA_ID=CAMNT_0040366287 /DNA_START=37 /DNA_END=2553 /DNA_ORIENTATION=-